VRVWKTGIREDWNSRKRIWETGMLESSSPTLHYCTLPFFHDSNISMLSMIRP
jgi:hypothetical protein